MRRRPEWLYRAGEDPDPRFSLANERTFLAWVRTALAFVAGGVALHSLEVPEQPLLRSLLVLGLMVLGAATVAGSAVRWTLVERAMRTSTPLPSLLLGLMAALGLTVVIVVIAGVLVVGGG